MNIINEHTYIPVFIFSSILLFLPFFAIVDTHIENSITSVNGTFEQECYYGGKYISNSSDPWPWIRVDGEKYIAREVDIDRWGDVGASLIGRFEPGDQVSMDLFPYKTYNFWNDTPGWWMIMYCLPVGMVNFVFFHFRFRGGKAK